MSSCLGSVTGNGEPAQGSTPGGRAGWMGPRGSTLHLISRRRLHALAATIAGGWLILLAFLLPLALAWVPLGAIAADAFSTPLGGGVTLDASLEATWAYSLAGGGLVVLAIAISRPAREDPQAEASLEEEHDLLLEAWLGSLVILALATGVLFTRVMMTDFGVPDTFAPSVGVTIPCAWLATVGASGLGLLAGAAAIVRALVRLLRARAGPHAARENAPGAQPEDASP